MKGDYDDDSNGDGDRADCVTKTITLTHFKIHKEILLKSDFLVCYTFLFFQEKNWNYRNLWCNQQRQRETKNDKCHRNAINEIETIGLKQIESHTEYTSR